MSSAGSTAPSIVAAARCDRGHDLHANPMPSNVCDSCGKTGTNYRCDLGCDYDLCNECHATYDRYITAPVAIPRSEELATLSKDDLIALLESVRLQGSVPDAMLQPLALKRVTTNEQLELIGALLGEWEDDHRAIIIEGTAWAPTVRFTRSDFRAPARMRVSDVVFEASCTPAGESTGCIRFQVIFPPDEVSKSGQSSWTLHTGGRVEIISDNGPEEDQMRRPKKKIEVRREMMASRPARISMARMTEPSSKALGLYDGLPPYKLYDDDGKPWCLPVLQTEATLRLDEGYLAEAGYYFDKGLVPPVELCESAERAALEAHGIIASEKALGKCVDSWIEAYRFAARMLPKVEREGIFFLRANDKLFRPNVDLCGRQLEGQMLDATLQPTSCRAVLAAQPRTLLIASTAS